jgi:hypothetical protein
MNALQCIALLAAVCASTTGCYFSNPPSTPHGHDPMHVEQLPTLTVSATPVQLASRRVIVLSRFDSTATQPIGGLYDFNDYESSPLIRTYYFKHANLELFEHACDALRATGLDVRKDYATTGEASLIERPLRELQPLMVRTKIISLQHDQVRTDSDPPTDNEVVKLVVDVSVIDALGASRYQARHAIYGRLTWQEELDVLRMLGLRLGERLARDPAFLRAVEATTRGAS